MSHSVSTATGLDTEPFRTQRERAAALRAVGLKWSLRKNRNLLFELAGNLSPAIVRTMLATTATRKSWELTANEVCRVRAMLLWSTLANDTRRADARFPFDTFTAKDIGMLPPGYHVWIGATPILPWQCGVVSFVDVRREVDGELRAVASVDNSKRKEEIDGPAQLPEEQSA